MNYSVTLLSYSVILLCPVIYRKLKRSALISVITTKTRLFCPQICI